MKLKNKKTGEIVELCSRQQFYEDKTHLFLDTKNGRQYYDSLAELNEEWEDAPEEPKGYYYVTTTGLIKYDDTPFCAIHKDRKEIGNYFETREEAELAMEKLKVWKRLKDKGFRFTGWNGTMTGRGIEYKAGKYYEKWIDDMNLIFGGDE